MTVSSGFSLLALFITSIAVVAFVFFILRGKVKTMNQKRSVGIQNATTVLKSSYNTGVTCNGITASSIMTKDPTGSLRNACRCHWPTLFGQETLYSDCNIQHACDNNKGVLVHKVTRKPLISAVQPIDIHDYECSQCDRCNVPGTDPHTGLPSCVPRPLNDRDRDLCLYNVASESDVYFDAAANDSNDGEYHTAKPMLALRSRFVDRRFVSLFTDRVRDTAWVPNPCAYDLFTGIRLESGCELRLTKKSNIAYCAPLRDNIMTAVKEDTYLINNLGTYPNACFRFTSNEHHVNGYIIEYFLRERRSQELPSPVVSMRIARKDVLGSVVKGLGLTRVPKEKMLLFTQPEPPSDVNEFPHPFNKRRMADFNKEFNYWLDILPAKCSGLHILYNCSAPIQALPITECTRIGDTDRNPSDKKSMPHGSVIGDQTEEYARSTVSCRNPEYDARFPIVPNYETKLDSTDSTLTSAILFFDKTNNTVYPHWKELGENVSSEVDAIHRYVQVALRSAPNDVLK